MILPIATYGDDCLRKKAAHVAAITPQIKDLAADMLETMYHAEGVGLAAPQVGRDAALCVMDVPAQSEKPECREANAEIEMPLVMVNPEVLSTSGSQRNNEGCLSFPEINVMVTRPDTVTVAFTNLDGERRTLSARGLLARAIQHEVDHLNATLLVDRMSALQKVSVSGKLKRLQAEHK
jgi:peptide deformylase